MIYNKKKFDNIDKRIYLIENKIIELNNSIKNMENQKNSIINDAYNSLDENIIYNNLSVIYSLIYHYEGQKYFLMKKIREYYLIIVNKNSVEKKEFLDIWKQQVDIFLLDSTIPSNFYKEIEKYKKFDFDDENNNKELIKIS